MAKKEFKPKVVTYANDNYDQRNVYVCNTVEEYREAVKDIFYILDKEEKYFDALNNALITSQKSEMERNAKMLEVLQTLEGEVLFRDEYSYYASILKQLKRKNDGREEKKLKRFMWNISSYESAKKGNVSEMIDLIREMIDEDHFIHFNIDNIQ